jgi:hypothetical protein
MPPARRSRSGHGHGTFSGDPKAIWLTEADVPDRRMKLLEDFSFTDPEGKKWSAEKDYAVDGASIPRALWTLVGSPYTGDYRRASVVHDKACDEAGSDKSKRRAADRMFYHACRAGGCSIQEAILLYLGVRIGALATHVPAWRAAVAPQVMVTQRLVRPAPEDRLEADFRMAASRVFEEPETDDPIEIERRADEALSSVSGIDLRGK